jgi:hypothetical protein
LKRRIVAQLPSKLPSAFGASTISARLHKVEPFFPDDFDRCLLPSEPPRKDSRSQDRQGLTQSHKNRLIAKGVFEHQGNQGGRQADGN